MQQTKSYWRLLAFAGVASAFVASACVVTTSTDDDDVTAGAGGGAGTAGSGTSGAATAGAGTAGAGTAGAGTAGAPPAGGAGSVSFQCDPAEGGAMGEPNSCAPNPPNDACGICIQGQCCADYSACYATDPGNQCGWGGPGTFDGVAVVGELGCVQACLKKAVAASQIAPTNSEVEACANNCATSPTTGATTDCGEVIGIQTSDTIACLRANCSLPCFGAE